MHQHTFTNRKPELAGPAVERPSTAQDQASRRLQAVEATSDSVADGSVDASYGGANVPVAESAGGTDEEWST